MWGSTFTTKAAKLQGDSGDFAVRLNVKLWVLTACLLDCMAAYRLFRIAVENANIALKFVFVECGVAGRAGVEQCADPPEDSNLVHHK